MSIEVLKRKSSCECTVFYTRIYSKYIYFMISDNFFFPYRYFANFSLQSTANTLGGQFKGGFRVYNYCPSA